MQDANLSFVCEASSVKIVQENLKMVIISRQYTPLPLHLISLYLFRRYFPILVVQGVSTTKKQLFLVCVIRYQNKYLVFKIIIKIKDDVKTFKGFML